MGERLEKFIRDYFPGLAANRSAARTTMAQQDAHREIIRSSHVGGVGNRLSTAWNPYSFGVGGTPQEQWDLAEMADRAVSLYKSNVVVQTLIDCETSNIVGDGFTLKPNTGIKAVDEEIFDRYYDWQDRCDYAGFCTGPEFDALCWRQPRLEGDGLEVLVSTQDARGEPISRLQYLSRQQISNPGGLSNTEGLIDGVELDAASRPIAFHVRSGRGFTADNWTRVIADNAIYFCWRKHPLHVRGTTVLSTIFDVIDQIVGCRDAVSVAMRAAAAISIIFKVEDPQKEASAFAARNTLVDGQGTTRRGLYIENGSVKWIGQKNEVAQIVPQQPMAYSSDWMLTMFREACLAFDMPVEIGRRDLSQGTYAGFRVGLQQYYRACKAKQEAFISRKKSREYRWWLSREKNLGTFTNKLPENYWKHNFMGREWEYTDPYNEVMADAIEIALGIQSEDGAATKRGRDTGTIRLQRDAFRKANQDAGIPTVLPVATRDETVKTTLVDANGNPVNTAAAGPLNGAQIDGAIKVITGLSEKTISAAAAKAMLNGLAIAPSDVTAIVTAAGSDKGLSPDDKAYQRDVLKQLLTVPAAREALFNAIGIKGLITSTGLPPELEKGQPLDVPFIPVVAPTGPLVDGQIIRDGDGDIVGGDVEQKTERPVELSDAKKLPSTESTTGPDRPEHEAPLAGPEEDADAT